MNLFQHCPVEVDFQLGQSMTLILRLRYDPKVIQELEGQEIYWKEHPLLV
ncbi:hypothetical protein QGP82_00015 [Leptothoe sp. LEGE 181152]|nr:hypothetical protein [Leptothoe sp. LEGE 181152]